MPDSSIGGANDPEGRYANYFRIGFNAYEFIIDFGHEYPPDPERVHTRIVTSAGLAKSLSDTLEQSIQNYEAAFGPPPIDSKRQTEERGE